MRDPHEQKNVAEESADVAKALEQRLWEWKDQFRETAGEPHKVQLTDEQVEKLRSLGYLDAPGEGKSNERDSGKIRYSLATRELILGPSGREIHVVPKAMDGVLDVVREQGDRVVFRGWASDGSHRRPADQVAVFVNGKAKHANHTVERRRDVAGYFNVSTLTESGFSIVFPKRVFEQDPAVEVRVFAISSEGMASELRYGEQSLDGSLTLKFGKR